MARNRYAKPLCTILVLIDSKPLVPYPFCDSTSLPLKYVSCTPSHKYFPP